MSENINFTSPLRINEQSKFKTFEEAKTAAEKIDGNEVIVLREEQIESGEKQFYFTLHKVSNEQIKTYQNASVDPNIIAFSIDKKEGSPEQLYLQLKSNLKLCLKYIQYFPPDKVEDKSKYLKEVPKGLLVKFDIIAQYFGFNDFSHMRFQLRNIPTEKLEEIMNKILEKFNSFDLDKNSPMQIQEECNDIFIKYIKENIEDLFTQNNPPFKPPIFKESETDPEKWKPAELVGIYNALSEIKQRSFKNFNLICQSNSPLEFVREKTGDITRYGNDLMSLLTASIEGGYRIGNHIYLRNVAVTGKDREVMTETLIKSLSLIDNNKWCYGKEEIEKLGYFKPNKSIDREKILKDLKDVQNSEDKKQVKFLQSALNSVINSILEDQFKTSGDQMVKFAISQFGIYDKEKLLKFTEDQKAGYKTERYHFLLVDGNWSTNMTQILEKLSPNDLLQVKFLMDKFQSCAGLQKMLNETIGEGGSQLKVDGIIGPVTSCAIKQFQVKELLNFVKDKFLESNPHPSIRNNILIKMDKLFEKLTSGIIKDETVLGKIISEVYSFINELINLEPPLEKKELIKEKYSDRDKIVDGNFETGTAKLLVDNWLDIMDETGGKDFTEQIITHEIGHVLQEQPGLLKEWSRISWFEKNILDREKVSMNVTIQAAGKEDKSFSSDYAYTNYKEDFAEAYRSYIHDPGHLMFQSIIKFLFLNTFFEVYNTDEILKLASNNNISKEQILKALDSIRGFQDFISSKIPREISKFTQKREFSSVTIIKILDFHKELCTKVGFKSGEKNIPINSEAGFLELLTKEFSISYDPNQEGESPEKLNEMLDNFIDKGPEVLGDKIKSQLNKLPKEIQQMIEVKIVDGEDINKKNRIIFVATAKLIGINRALKNLEKWQEFDKKVNDDMFQQGGFYEKVYALGSKLLNHLKIDPEGSKIRELESLYQNLQKSYIKLENLQQNSDPNSKQIILNEIENSLKQILGKRIYEQLPDSFKKLLLNDPEITASITGGYGKFYMNLISIQKTIFDKLEKIEIFTKLEKTNDSYLEDAVKYIVNSRLTLAESCINTVIRFYNNESGGSIPPVTLKDLNTILDGVDKNNKQEILNRLIEYLNKKFK